MRTALLALMVVLSFAVDIDYINQGTWPGLCQTGLKQSPIDIPCTDFLNICPAAKNFQIYWNLESFNNVIAQEEDMKSNFTNRMWLKFSNQTNDYIYKSAQLHFHIPSEHTINGKHYDMQMHIVHANSAATEYAVLGLLFQIDANATRDIFDQVDFSENHNSTSVLFPFPLKNNAVYHYQGSFTTPTSNPPCAEIVNWFVRTEPLPLRPSNYQAFHAKLSGGHPNARLPLRLNSRTVYAIGRECNL